MEKTMEKPYTVGIDIGGTNTVFGVVDARANILSHDSIKTKDYPDILAVTYYAGNFSKLMNKEYSYEIQDLYCQLDRDLEQLFDGIDKKVGLSQTLIVFCGSGYYKSEEDYSEGLSLNNGEFHPKRCVALLNMYLMALYGQQTNWVTGYYNHQIFLNRKAIEDAKMDCPCNLILIFW